MDKRLILVVACLVSLPLKSGGQDGKPWNTQVNVTTSAADTITAFADLFTTHPQL